MLNEYTLLNLLRLKFQSAKLYFSLGYFRKMAECQVRAIQIGVLTVWAAHLQFIPLQLWLVWQHAAIFVIANHRIVKCVRRWSEGMSTDSITGTLKTFIPLAFNVPF